MALELFLGSDSDSNPHQVLADLRNAVNSPQAKEHLQQLSKTIKNNDLDRWDRVSLKEDL